MNWLNSKIRFNSIQHYYLSKRMERSLNPKYSECELINMAEKAETMEEVTDIVLQSGICDYCDFTDVNLDTALMFTKIIASISYRYPRIRSRMCYLGSKEGFVRVMQKLCQSDYELIKKLGIDKICSEDTIVMLAVHVLNGIGETQYNDKECNVLAQAFQLCGVLDGIILDEADFRGMGYYRLCKQLAMDEQIGLCAKGCGTPESVIYHEIGHMFDYLCNITESNEFKKYHGSLSKEKIEKELSEYGASNPREFFAEAFMEYMCSTSPRKIALDIGKMFESIYNNI